jgi:hypothetical protein
MKVRLRSVAVVSAFDLPRRTVRAALRPENRRSGNDDFVIVKKERTFADG